MAPQDSAGRIHKQALVASTSALFGLTLIAVVARLTIRFTMQRKFAIDDAVLLVGVCTLVAAFVILQSQVVDGMYMTVALRNRVPGVVPPGDVADIMQMGYDFHKWVTVTLILSWCSIMAAKFSILAFFWKLIDRIYWMKMYWFGVFVLNLGILGYGACVYYLGCPYFYDPRSFECDRGAGKHLLLTHSSVQTGLDILGDLMILFIPINIIWKIRVRIAQKIALFLSLGLTIIMIIITIIRVSGIVKEDAVDTIWETYWLVLGGEVGIFIASAIAFRAFFVNRSQSKNSTPPEERFFSYSFAKKFRRRGVAQLDSLDDQGLPSIPGAQLTGMRSFIDKRGRSIMGPSQTSQSTWEFDELKDGGTV